MKRKNCSISAATPGAVPRPGPCDDNLAGRLRGTDLNRNYPGFWGGGGASPIWSSDTFRGDGPGSEPESDAVRKLISERAVTVMISNHTYSNLVLRPPAIAATGLAIDEPELKALGDAMAAKNAYISQASYQLYDTSGSTEDWSYWITGGFGYTIEIGDEGFHPAYEKAVVGEYLGEAPAAGAGLGGNRRRTGSRSEAAADDDLHSASAAPPRPGHTISVSKTVIVGDLTGDPARRHDRSDPLLYRTTCATTTRPTGGRFDFDVNPSTRPLVMGRYGREAQAPPQAPITLSQPGRRPGGRERASPRRSRCRDCRRWTTATGGVHQLAGSRRRGPGLGLHRHSVLTARPVGSGATLANPEVIRIPDPQPGTYTLEANNYAGGYGADDWSGDGDLREPDPAQRDRHQGGLAAELRRQARRRAGDPRGGRRPRRGRRRRQRLQEGQGLTAL